MITRKIASWNVNSVRSRLVHVLAWLEMNPDIDVLCLQETKVVNDLFPLEEFEDMGYHVYIHGQKSYNGVAFISKHPLVDVEMGFPEGDLNEQTRVISASLEGVHLINIYAPQGESPESEKYAFKRAFYERLLTWLETDFSPEKPLVVCGDYNIAPDARDVHDVEKVTGKCMFLPEEHSWLEALSSWGLHDSFRLVSDAEKVFSWWDYRQGSFQRNKGLRIDHHYVSTALKDAVIASTVDATPRDWEKPSDHAPVILTYKK